MLTPEDVIQNISRCTGFEIMFRFSLSFSKYKRDFGEKDGLAGGNQIPISHSKSCLNSAFRKLTTV
jgi:hypothetical protein